MQTEPFWQAININRLENVQLSMRDLTKYLDPISQDNFITNFEDNLDHEGIGEHDIIPNYSNLQSYQDRVESYIRKHKDHLVIQKLKTNRPITVIEINALETILFDGVTIGTKQDYTDHYGKNPLGEFICGIIGLDNQVAQAAFADFIQAGHLRADQMTFIKNIISYLTKNGTIDKKILFEAPFTNIHDQGLLGVFDDADAMNVIKLIDQLNRNALAA